MDHWLTEFEPDDPGILTRVGDLVWQLTGQTAPRQAADRELVALATRYPAVAAKLVEFFDFLDPVSHAQWEVVFPLGNVLAEVARCRPDIAAVLLRAVAEPLGHYRSQAATFGLAERFRQPTDPVVRVLLAHLDHEVWRVRRAAALALSTLGQPDPPTEAAMDVLAGRGSHPPRSGQAQTAVAAAPDGDVSPPEDLPPLGGALEAREDRGEGTPDREDQPHGVAEPRLQTRPSTRNVGPLEAVLQDSDGNDSQAGGVAGDVVKGLALLMGDPVGEVRQAAEAGLGTLLRAQPEFAADLPPVVQTDLRSDIAAWYRDIEGDFSGAVEALIRQPEPARSLLLATIYGGDAVLRDLAIRLLVTSTFPRNKGVTIGMLLVRLLEKGLPPAFAPAQEAIERLAATLNGWQALDASRSTDAS